MMGDFGSYSYSWNSSASAPPFTVDPSTAQRPATTGFDDFFNESSNSYVSSWPPNTSTPNPQRFSYPEFKEMAASYGTHRLPPSQPYSPYYASTQLEVLQTLGFPGYRGFSPPNCETAKSSSMGGHTANPSLYEDSFGFGNHASENYKKNLFASRDDTRNTNTSRRKAVASAGAGQFSEKYFTGKRPHSMPAYNSKNLALGFTSEPPEIFPQKPSLQPIDSCSNEVSLSSSQENFPEQHRVSHEINTPNLVAPLPSSSSWRKFDASQIRIHLEGNDHNSLKDILTEKETPSNKSVCNCTSENLFGAESNFQGFCIDAVNPSMALGCDEATNYIKNSFESLDHYNPTVDSPCWKGDSFPPSSSFEVFKFARPQLSDKPGEFSGSPQVFTVSSNDAVKNSSKNPSECSLVHGCEFLDHIFASSLEGPSAPNLLSEECESYDAKKAESNSAKSGVSHATQSWDHVNQPSNKDVLINKSINKPDINPYSSIDQSFGEDTLSSEKQSTMGGDLENFRVNGNKVSDCSHGPFNAAKEFSSPCSSLEGDSAERSKHSYEIYPPDLNVHSLVNAVHNLSELLLHGCSNEASKLKEQECETLKKVINNLDKCLMKTTGQKAKAGQASIPEQAASFNIVKLQEDGCLINQLVKEMEHQSDGYGDAETATDDKMTQSIKSILAWNFPDDEEIQPQVLLYKNLWLEAEAALCSTTYMARFNRIKNEIEKYKLLVAKESSTERSSPSPCTTQKSEPVLNRCQTAQFWVQNSPIIDCSSNENDVMARLLILKSRDFRSNSVDDAAAENSEASSVSPDPNLDEKSEPDAFSGLLPDASVQDSHNVGKRSHVNDFTDRFQVLKCRAEKNSEQTLDSDKVGEPSTEEKSSQIPETPIWDSRVLSISSHPDDLEASAIARFCILKSRVDPSSPKDLSATEHKVDGISDSTSVQPVLQHNVMSSHLTNIHGNELSSARGYESSSSDWEHVLKEELAG